MALSLFDPDHSGIFELLEHTPLDFPANPHLLQQVARYDNPLRP
jgi:hypothetical protein